MIWRCGICGALRPDEAIAVRSAEREIAGVGFTENIRYCNDRPDCVAGAERAALDPDHWRTEPGIRNGDGTPSEPEHFHADTRPWWRRLLGLS